MAPPLPRFLRLGGLLLLVGLLVCPAPAFGLQDSPAPPTAAPSLSDPALLPQPAPDQPASGYADLSELTTRICSEAVDTFADFFAPAPVEVQPFRFIGPVVSESTSFGVLLADQMTALLNSRASARFSGLPAAASQTLEGNLQEVNGFLRIHIHATNAGNRRRSHVATIEMSEPLYRALHTQIQAW